MENKWGASCTEFVTGQKARRDNANRDSVMKKLLEAVLKKTFELSKAVGFLANSGLLFWETTNSESMNITHLNCSVPGY